MAHLHPDDDPRAVRDGSILSRLDLSQQAAIGTLLEHLAIAPLDLLAVVANRVGGDRVESGADVGQEDKRLATAGHSHLSVMRCPQTTIRRISFAVRAAGHTLL